MTDDVRIATSLRRHRKTKRLKRLLGVEACWSLVCLFLWAGEERWTGDLSGLSDADIEEEADWEGEEGAFVAALIEVRFLVGDANERRIHDWQEHNPYAASKGARIEKGKRAAKARWEKSPEDAPSNKNDAPSMPRACREHATHRIEQCPPAPAPTPTNSSTDTSSQGTRDERAAPGGTFEGHAARPPEAPNPIAPYAIALNRAGFRCTALNPDLIAYHCDGGSVEHLTEIAAHEDCAGKSATYVIRFARRELTAKAKPINGASHEPSRKLSASEQTRAAIAARRARESADAAH